MPRGDRTGPNGMGPMTGRGAGFCAGYPEPGYENPGFGRGRGAGRGGGRGFGRGGGGGGYRHRHWFLATGVPGWQRGGADKPVYAPPVQAGAGSATTKEQELAALKNQAAYFEQKLTELQKRISEFESNAGAEKAE